MANTREIQSRIKSINDTLKITNAMYMISSSKLKRLREIMKILIHTLSAYRIQSEKH